MSFPVIDRFVHAEGEDALYILSPIEDQTDYFEIINQPGYMNAWYGDFWVHPPEIDILDSKKGYKLHSPDNLDIPTSGFKMPDGTQIDLVEGLTWVGYFIEESLPIQTALADIWDFVMAVYSEDWAYEAGPVPPERASMIYGKMYKIVVDRDCSFTYVSGPPVIPKERQMTEGFIYSETPMYTVVNIATLDDPDALEIGMFLDNECIGGTVIDDEPVQILAFPQNGNLDGEVHFEIYSGSRSSNRIIRNFTVYDPGSKGSRKNSLDLRPYMFNYIRFDELSPEVMKFSTANYPNPFNPETVITYNLSVDSKVELNIYNIRGQQIKMLVNKEQPSGSHNVMWDGRDERGRPVSSGVYFYRITAGDLSEQRKMLLLK